MTSDKALNPATLELTQKIQLHLLRLPQNISPAIIKAWNDLPKEILQRKLYKFFGQYPQLLTASFLHKKIYISATKEPFIAKDKFKLKEDGGIFSEISDDFIEDFLSEGGKIEKPIEGQTLCYSSLMEALDTELIIAELGGKKRAEISLAEIFLFIEKHPVGEHFDHFIAYIKNRNEELREVNVILIEEEGGLSIDSRQLYLSSYGSGWGVLSHEIP